MSKKPKASVLNMIERERHRVAATVTKEQDWDQPEPNNGLARMFVIMLLIHVFVIGGIIIYDFVGGDSTPKSAQASSPISSARSTSTAASVPAAIPLISQAPLASPRQAPQPAAETPPVVKAVAYNPPAPITSTSTTPSKTTPAPATTSTPASSSPVVIAKATITTAPSLNHDSAASKPAATSVAASRTTESEKSKPAADKPKTVADKPRIVADKPKADIADRTPSQPKPVMTPSAARRALDGDKTPAPKVAKKKDKEDSDSPPASSKKSEKSHGSSKYTVVKGDTFYRLARRYNTTEEALMKANGIKNANALALGKTITIPASR